MVAFLEYSPIPALDGGCNVFGCNEIISGRKKPK